MQAVGLNSFCFCAISSFPQLKTPNCTDDTLLAGPYLSKLFFVCWRVGAGSEEKSAHRGPSINARCVLAAVPTSPGLLDRRSLR